MDNLVLAPITDYLSKDFLKKQLSLSINRPMERLKSVSRGGWILTVTNEAVLPL